MDEYDTLEYSWVKAITVSVRLRNFLCVLTITNMYAEKWVSAHFLFTKSNLLGFAIRN
jgi:hypothetical protein